MRNYVLFQMDSGFRAQLIEKHNFYVQQAKRRLLDPLTDEAISQLSETATEESWQRRGRNFDPDRHDPSDFAEAAYEDGAWRFQLLAELRASLRMSIIVGFFHEWEKNLRQWLVDEIRHWHDGGSAKDQIWRANLVGIFELLESFGWPLKASNYFLHLDACRLVVNVHKHGDGPSLKELNSSFPSYLDRPRVSMFSETSFNPSHERLKITDANLAEFSNAIVQFWKELPEKVLNSQITNPPSWFTTAIEKDRVQRGEVQK